MSEIPRGDRGARTPASRGDRRASAGALAQGSAAPTLRCVIVRAFLHSSLVLLLWLAGTTAAWADDAQRLGGRPFRARTPDLSLFTRQGTGSPAMSLPRGVALRAERARARGGPVCAGDVCQPQVDVPGLRTSFRASRTDAVLAVLSHTRLGPLSRTARFVAASNVRVDYSPGTPDGQRGWGRVVVSLRWRN